ncbi:MAG: cytochrome c biogenesis protein CcdA, partial [Nitrospinaceae bacterium]|nr:cytochrome c biogenesis protein CcdA [Nitrospinaceae bacterium]
MPGDSVSFGLAFMAGMLSFVSPCVLPLFPSYISSLTGL